MLYKDIPRSIESVESLRNKVNKNIATRVERCQYDVYCCMCFLLDSTSEKLKAKVYDELWNANRSVLYNLREA